MKKISKGVKSPESNSLFEETNNISEIQANHPSRKISGYNSNENIQNVYIKTPQHTKFRQICKKALINNKNSLISKNSSKNKNSFKSEKSQKIKDSRENNILAEKINSSKQMFENQFQKLALKLKNNSSSVPSDKSLIKIDTSKSTVRNDSDLIHMNSSKMYSLPKQFSKIIKDKQNFNLNTTSDRQYQATSTSLPLSTVMKLDLSKVNRLNTKSLFTILTFSSAKEINNLWLVSSYLRKKLCNIFIHLGKLVFLKFQERYKENFDLLQKYVTIGFDKKHQEIKVDLKLSAVFSNNSGFKNKVVNFCFYKTVNGHVIFDMFKFDSIDSVSAKHWLAKECSINPLTNIELAYTNPICSFKKEDHILLTVNLFKLGIIQSFKWSALNIAEDTIPSFKCEDLHNYQELCTFDLSRICELEILKNSWVDLNHYDDKTEKFEIYKELFKNNFKIEKMWFDNIGLWFFKFEMLAENEGFIDAKFVLGLCIEVVGKNKPIFNEIRRNGNLFDSYETFQVRIGDRLTFYASVKCN